MARSREVEQKRRVRAALRALRRIWRGLDSSGEKLERTLDRLINRSTLVYADQLEPMIGQWRDVQNRVTAVEKALADTMTIAAF